MPEKTAKKPRTRKPAAKETTKKAPKAEVIRPVRVELDDELGWICVCSDGGRRKATRVEFSKSRQTVSIDFDHPEDGFSYGLAGPTSRLVKGFKV